MRARSGERGGPRASDRHAGVAIARGDGRRATTEEAAKHEALHAIERGEPEGDRSAPITAAPPRDDAHDCGLGVDPQAERHGLEGHDQGLADLHLGLAPDEHPVGRQIERMIADESKVALAHHLTRELDVAADLTSKRALNRHAHRVSEGARRWPIRGAWLALAAIVTAGLACKEPDPQPPAAGSTYGPVPFLPTVGSDADDAGGDGDGGGDDGGAPLCPEGDTAPDFRFVSGFGGPLAVAGELTTPAVVEANRAVVLELTDADGGEVRSAAFRSPGPPRDRFRYRITGLREGRWLVRAQIDQVGAPTVGDVGDLDGFYAGTEAAPLRDPAEADAIPLTDRCVEDGDFGIGVKF